MAATDRYDILELGIGEPGTFGRPAASRNDVNILLDLSSMQYAAFEAPTSDGLLDPTIGVRYSGVSFSDRTDFGVQATAQRFGNSHALYAGLSTVYYAGTNGFVPSGSQFIPTLVFGYERRLRAHQRNPSRLP